jgi:hypothetical protein
MAEEQPVVHVPDVRAVILVCVSVAAARPTCAFIVIVVTVPDEVMPYRGPLVVAGLAVETQHVKEKGAAAP